MKLYNKKFLKLSKVYINEIELLCAKFECYNKISPYVKAINKQLLYTATRFRAYLSLNSNSGANTYDM